MHKLLIDPKQNIYKTHNIVKPAVTESGEDQRRGPEARRASGRTSGAGLWAACLSADNADSERREKGRWELVRLSLDAGTAATCWERRSVRVWWGFRVAV